ncbi:hypothetical protein BraRD5C2_40080 [Bradyrhizobium sp. RD5-C2]|nr:hypothetical protein BraRD5C2_40080 [Bradyrhizobium sp. RD5-C2]
MSKRRCVQQTLSLQQRLAQEARGLREAAKAFPPCPEREALLRKVRQDEAASHTAEWLSPSGIRGVS